MRFFLIPPIAAALLLGALLHAGSGVVRSPLRITRAVFMKRDRKACCDQDNGS